MDRPNLATCPRRTALEWIRYIEAENVRLTDRVLRLEQDVLALRGPENAHGPARPADNALGGFSRESDTSRKAAIDNYPRSGSQRERVMLAIARAGQRGMTRDELVDATGYGDSSVDGRVWELTGGGWVRKDVDGRKRKTRSGSKADVLVLTDKGYRAVTREGHIVQEPPPVTGVPADLQGSLLGD